VVSVYTLNPERDTLQPELFAPNVGIYATPKSQVISPCVVVHTRPLPKK